MTALCAVLVIEDDESIRETLELVLASEGYEVMVASHGGEALGVLARWRPHVILLDLNMPVMDGWAFRREQRRRPPIADIPVIVLSASMLSNVRMSGLGAVKFLPKPFDVDSLFDVIAGALGHRPGPGS